MEELIKQYAQPIIIIVVVIALIAIFVMLLNSDTGVISDEITKLITGFFDDAKTAAGQTPPGI